MKALQVSSFGREPIFLDMPVPVAAPGSITLKVAACGLNFADLLMIRGTYQNTPKPPFSLGLEFAGTVTQTGFGVKDFEIGDRVVCFNGHAGLADYAHAPTSSCLKLSEDLNFEIAAATCVTFGTAHLALKHRAKLRPGDVILVTGAGGGTGLAAIKMAKALGATVWAICNGAEKQAAVFAAGADLSFEANNPRLLSDLKDLGGADVIFDTVGGALFETCFRACKPGGQYLIIGFAGGDAPQIPANIALVKNLTLHGVNWPGVRTLDSKLFYQSLAEVFDLVTAGKLRPAIGHRYPFAETLQALADLKARKTTGKVIITFD